MKRFKLLATVLLISGFSFGQVVKIQTGVSISSLDWQVSSPDWIHDNETLMGCPVFIGLDYLDKKYFNLSSNIGLLKKGGKVTLKNTNPAKYVGDQITETNLDYLSVNTTCDFKYPLENKITPFIGIGPRIDLLLNDISFINKFSYGLLLGGGFKYDINKIQIGLRVDYYLNFNKINKAELYGTLRDKTVTTSLVVGYRLK
jgi:hypothetical protein